MPSNTYTYPLDTCTYTVEISWQECWSNDETEMVDIEFAVYCSQDGEEVLVTDDENLFWEVDPYSEEDVYDTLVGRGLILGVDETRAHVNALHRILNH